ncbi:MAG: DUF2336 domain-containing protein [Rickettsiales bacterium]
MSDSSVGSRQPAARLTENDVKHFAESSVEKRLELTRRLVEAYHYKTTPDAYRLVADDVFRVLAKDASKEVRAFFSDLIKTSDKAPHDVVRRLAFDEVEVATSVLEGSPLLTEKDVMDVIAESGQSEPKLFAIAGRPFVSKPVSFALADSGFGAVAAKLSRNENADVGEKAFRVMLDRYAQEERAMTALLSRASVPPSVMDMAARRISHAMLREIGEKHPFLQGVAFKLIGASAQEVGKVNGDSDAKDYVAFAKKMREAHVGDDIAGIIALALAKPRFFEHYLSQTLNVPPVNVRKLLEADSERGFYALYHRAKMPPHLYGAVKLLHEAARRVQPLLRQNDLATELSASNRMIETMQLLAEESEAEIEHLDYIVALVRYSQRVFAT